MTTEEIIKRLKKQRKELTKLIEELDPDGTISALDDEGDSSNPGGPPPPPPGPGHP